MTTTNQFATQSQAKSYSNLTKAETQELINQAQAGSQKALDQICEQYRPLVESISFSYTCHSALGEDATSIAWVLFLELIHKLKKPIKATFPGLVKRYLKHRLIDKLEEATKLDQFSFAEEEDIQEKPCLTSFEEQLADNELLKQAFAMLKPEQQNLLYAHYYEDKTLVDIAAKQRLKVGTVKMQHHRILKELRKHLLQDQLS